MLQWMGGSRRKVTTSRKSTQKRQKQYFEQRKRQQQQTAGLEGYYSNKTDTCSPHQENSRSLDILSLLNLSTNGQECKSSCPNARRNSEVDLSRPNHLTEQSPTATQKEPAKVFPADTIDFKKKRTASNYQQETVCPVKVSFDSSAEHTEAIDGKSAEVDQFKIASNRSLSVLDLLGDDGQNSHSDRNLVHEAHVAFSVEGLGKVEMETPVHSPEQPGRAITHGCPSPFKSTKRAHSSNYLDFRLDDLEPEVGLASKECEMRLHDSVCILPNDLMHNDDILFCSSSPLLEISSRGMMEPFSDLKQKIPFDRSSPEPPYFSSSKMEPFSDPKQKIPFDKAFSLHNYNSDDKASFFGEKEIFYNCEDQDEYRLNGSSFLGENFLDEENDLSWKDWPCDLDFSASGYLNHRNWDKPNFSSESFHTERRSRAKAGQRFSYPESSAPHAKYKISENYNNFISPDKIWYPIVGRTDVRDVSDQPEWSSFITDHDRESLSLLSEESCSSCVVWREATKKSPHHNMARQKMRRRADNSSRPRKKSSLQNDDYARDQGNNSNSLAQQKSVDGEAGRTALMSDSSTSSPAHCWTIPSPETMANAETVNKKFILIAGKVTRE